MNTAIVKAQPTQVTAVQSVDDVLRLADIFSKSGMFQAESGHQSMAQLAVKIMAGQELGISPFAASNGMQIIKGKCAPGANLMAAKVKASGRYDYRVAKLTDAEAVIEFFERGVKVGVSQFTAADAQKAGTQNMGKFPRNMLYARAMSNGVKWYCPDLFNGVAVYTPDEMGVQGEYDDSGEFVVVDVQPEEPKRPHMRTNGEIVEPARPVANGKTPAAAVLNTLTVEQPEQPQDDSESVKKEKLHKRFHATGNNTFGKLWAAKGKEIIHAVTAGESTSSAALTDEEKLALIKSFGDHKTAWENWADGSSTDMPVVPVREVAENPFH